VESNRWKEINDLNISYNALNVHREEKDFHKFIEMLKEYLRTTRALTHLDVSGMQIGEYVKGLMPVIY